MSCFEAKDSPPKDRKVEDLSGAGLIIFYSNIMKKNGAASLLVLFALIGAVASRSYVRGTEDKIGESPCPDGTCMHMGYCENVCCDVR